MKKSPLLLFILRLFFYFSVTGLILLHPGISVSFDRIGFLQWFVIIPLGAVIAYLPQNIINYRNRLFIFLPVLLLFSILAGGFSPAALQPFFSGLVCFILTFLLFHYPRWGKLSVLEPFFLAWVCLRLLALSRSGEEIAGQSAALTQFILVWTITVFLLHGAVVYFCLYPKSSNGARKEGIFFAFGALAVLFLVMFVLPPDFVSNTVIGNLLSERIPEMIKEGSEKGIPKDAAGRGNRRGSGNGQSKLRGLSGEDWRNRRGRGDSGGENRQYLVMVVASKYEPVYMADNYRGKLDAYEGFLESDDEPLNRIIRQRFFVTWKNNEQNVDRGRRQREVFSLSTLPQKYAPYRPYSIDPTIKNENAGPLRYIHQSISDVYSGDPLELVRRPSRAFSSFEERMLASYLEINLGEEDLADLTGFLNDAIKNWNNNRENIINKRDHLLGIFSKTPEPEWEQEWEYEQGFEMNPHSSQEAAQEAAQKAAQELIKKKINKWLSDHGWDSAFGDWEEFWDWEELWEMIQDFDDDFYEEREQEPALVESDEKEMKPGQYDDNPYLEKILAILTYFSDFQYNLTYDEDCTVSAIKEFLFETKEGACTEFSNSLALLGRIAGIPSRVVTGYFAGESQQTQAHLQGLANLQDQIPFLQQFRFEELFMVTNIHAHSWTQFYIPEYGWLDFEGTEFSIPPVGMGNYNNWDVIIPVLDDNRIFSQVRKFPWRAVLKTAGMLAAFALVCAYLLHYARELVLYITVQNGKNIRSSARALYLLLLARLAADGKPIKPASKTALEYADLFPGAEKDSPFAEFAAIYSELRWREFNDSAERNKKFLMLKHSYKKILETTKRKGIYAVIRIFSLRGLAYL